MRVGDRVLVVGRTLTFLGKKYKGRVGKIIKLTTKHEVSLLKVRFSDGEVLYEEKDLEIYDG